jgi:hypothetical protein
MTASDYTETLDLFATMLRPVKIQFDREMENLRAENRNIRQRLTNIEAKLMRAQNDETKTDPNLPLVWDKTKNRWV